MRAIIKNADFSAVSIGKVIRDYSFDYKDYEEFITILDNPPSGGYTLPVSAGTGYNDATTYYMGSAADATLSIRNSVNRFASGLIEVTEGMVVKSTSYPTTSNMPSIVCFDASGNVLTPDKCGYGSQGAINFTIPSGVKFIKIQCEQITSAINIKGVMPSE